MISDRYMYDRGFVEDHNDPSKFYSAISTGDSFEGDEGMKYGIPIVRGAYAGPFPLVWPSIDPDSSEVFRNEHMTHYFINYFREVNDWDPSNVVVKITLASKSIMDS